MIRHSSKIFKLIFAILITLLCFLTIWLGTWKSPDVNHSGDINIHTCIHSDDRKLHFKLDAGVAKIQGAAKDLLKAEESFFVSLGESKQGFDEYLRGILQQQITDAA